jgi:hypothetical protein
MVDVGRARPAPCRQQQTVVAFALGMLTEIGPRGALPFCAVPTGRRIRAALIVDAALLAPMRVTLACRCERAATVFGAEARRCDWHRCPRRKVDRLDAVSLCEQLSASSLCRALSIEVCSDPSSACLPCVRSSDPTSGAPPSPALHGVAVPARPSHVWRTGLGGCLWACVCQCQDYYTGVRHNSVMRRAVSIRRRPLQTASLRRRHSWSMRSFAPSRAAASRKQRGGE